MGEAFDVVVIGNAGVDTNVYLSGADIDWEHESNFTDNVDYVAHSGAFASRGYARLGLRTAFVGFVGDDHNGDLVRRTLAGDGIDLTGLAFDPAGTDRSVNFVYQDGRRKNFYDGQGHQSLTAELETARQILAGAKLAHVNIPNWARALLPLCRELGVRIACDLQDVADSADPYRQDFIDAADFLFFSGTNQRSPDATIERFLEHRPNATVLSGLGADGVAFGSRNEVRHVPPPELDLAVIDTNGAGDSLAVGFLSSFVIDGLPMERSLMRAQIAARWCCTLRGRSDGLITRTQLDDLERSLG